MSEFKTLYKVVPKVVENPKIIFLKGDATSPN